MKKSVISFIAVLLVIIFLGVTAVTGVYIPGGWSMPFRDTGTAEDAPATAVTTEDGASNAETGTTDTTDQSADTADTTGDTAGTTDTSADSATDTSADSGSTDSSLRAIIPSVLDTENGIRLGLDLVGGSRIVYEAVLPEGYNMTDLPGDMQTAQAMIRQRLTSRASPKPRSRCRATTA